ncbi:hypothetical protein [Flavisolibacter ginsenosidimutans]|uniref:Uncharacterized protein n=1 Tax=Flavisolibacter ginsenosidimutans TaxID=661481 RepID=A0A5B8UDJ3_9BACT|nr:hypothetical protein [Flavisolibacter ginsenosidimutans]QEC54747.1 hypothetical protein FSB75_02135 [Flavisolibacter ginsenosidimutans]
MQGSKIQLSTPEMELFCNAQIILTKNSILQKTVQLLSEVQNQLLETASGFIRNASPSPKISKGENYLGLPYVVLDYPRIAKGEDLFFVRSMFWWGNFYSSTLQLGGSFKERHLSVLEAAHQNLAAKDYFIGVSQYPWEHHFEETNFQKINGLSAGSFAAVLEESTHTKIAARWPLQTWDSAANNLKDSWKFLTGLIA